MLAGFVLLLGAATAAPDPATLPSAQRARWRRVFFDHFQHGLRRHRWVLYSGQPSGDPGGLWSPYHVFVSHGILHITAYRDPHFGGLWVSGGLSSRRALRQTYGKYEVRLRVEPGRGVSFVALLWPTAPVWPPEVDFAESGGGETIRRRHMIATLHWGADNQEIHRARTANFTRWHTLGVEWTPGTLRYTMDGRVWSQVSGPQVPAQPMVLDMQTQTGTCGDRFAPCPDGTTPSRIDAEIAWVAAWRWTGR